MSTPMPAVFLGHGNPMNAIQNNDYTKGWTALGRTIPKPRAVLSISAHWYIPGTFVTAMPSPKTIHDFGGFPSELYQVKYPAPGDPDLARHIQKLLAPIPVKLDQQWGLDHGTWSVLCHVFPHADIPVVQLSIDEKQPASFHYNLGKSLAPLRDDRVLIIGSGDIVHNLRTYAWDRHDVKPFEWAIRFEGHVRDLLIVSDHGPLIAYETLGPDARLSVPTPDHYLPLLYVIALARDNEQISFPVEGVDGGSISMLAVQVG
jgi:4,5-DOPA dioxygenase extradiol